MRNKFLTVFACLAFILTLGMFSPASAQSVSGSASQSKTELAQLMLADYWTGVHCKNIGQGVTTCVDVDWSKQADGTGVYVHEFRIQTTNGCTELESGDGGRYNEAQSFFANPRTGATFGQESYGAEDCNWTKDISRKGGEEGTIDFRGALKARVNWANDIQVAWGFNLGPNGGYELTHFIAYEV